MRNMHLHVTGDRRYLGLMMCIASDEPNGFQSVSATIGLLGKDGDLIKSITTTYDNVGLLAGDAGGAPKLLLPFSTAADIDPNTMNRWPTGWWSRCRSRFARRSCRPAIPAGREPRC